MLLGFEDEMKVQDLAKTNWFEQKYDDLVELLGAMIAQEINRAISALTETYVRSNSDAERAAKARVAAEALNETIERVLEESMWWCLSRPLDEYTWGIRKRQCDCWKCQGVVEKMVELRMEFMSTVMMMDRYFGVRLNWIDDDKVIVRFAQGEKVVADECELIDAEVFEPLRFSDFQAVVAEWARRKSPRLFDRLRDDSREVWHKKSDQILAALRGTSRKVTRFPNKELPNPLPIESKLNYIKARINAARLLEDRDRYIDGIEAASNGLLSMYDFEAGFSSGSYFPGDGVERDLERLFDERVPCSRAFINSEGRISEIWYFDFLSDDTSVKIVFANQDGEESCEAFGQDSEEYTEELRKFIDSRRYYPNRFKDGKTLSEQGLAKLHDLCLKI